MASAFKAVGLGYSGLQRTLEAVQWNPEQEKEKGLINRTKKETSQKTASLELVSVSPEQQPEEAAVSGEGNGDIGTVSPNSRVADGTETGQDEQASGETPGADK
ncbi:hypothetical protein SKAU_G00107680 [Synaphobranchus kaupii]|uniref:Uncharacterized protein n=1 Tax=Synaphobranchus kaupii TaxID=118154 RepID=A0A9Q1J5X0_SYNKA|nr:hypothetical protein SKAU_G00107680 [Synaphobranchus kaupii]